MNKVIALFTLLVFTTLSFASNPQANENKTLNAKQSEAARADIVLAEADVDAPGACVQSNNLTGQKMCNEVPSKAFCGKGFPWVTSTTFYEGSKCCGDDAC